jgi:hypothetical protein
MHGQPHIRFTLIVLCGCEARSDALPFPPLHARESTDRHMLKWAYKDITMNKRLTWENIHI